MTTKEIKMKRLQPQMKLRQIGNNQTVVSMPETGIYRAMEVLFSYETPVVVRIPGSSKYVGDKYYVTTTKFSRGTTRHINSFVGDNDRTPVSQEALETIHLERSYRGRKNNRYYNYK